MGLQKKYKADNPNGDSSLFPLLRLILSNDENLRAYGIQEKTLRKLLIKCNNVSGSDRKRLEQCNEDEIAETVYEIAMARATKKESELTIKQIDDALNIISEDHKQQFQQLESLIMKGSACCQKWLVKIILKNMKVKITPQKILENIHSLGGTLFSKYNHLSTVLEFIESGQAEEAVKDVVKPFTPIRSMLAQKFSNDMNKILNNFEMYQEVKFDGERFQMHFDNNEFKWFSRNAHDFSDGFNAFISPLIKFKVVVHSVILDGEMIIWSKTDSRFITKGETDLDVKKMKDINHYLRPCYCAFDILYLNGVSFISRPYSERCEILNSLFEDSAGVLIKTKPTKVRDVEHLVVLFNDALNNREEGIILKKADSTYMPGEREKGGWFKIKADYFDGEVVKDFDCIVIGGFFQNAFKRDYIQKYELGAIEKKEDGTFNVYAIGEIVHGISVNERMNLDKKLMTFAVDYKGQKEIEFKKGKVFFGRSSPDVFLAPDQSIVLQVRSSELAPTSDFYTDYTFRFPRIAAIRNDKFWDESCTLKEFEEMCKIDDDNGATTSKNNRVKKINLRSVHKDDITSPTQKKKKIMKPRAAAISNFCKYSQEDLNDLNPIDNALEGKDFCVMSSSNERTFELKQLLKLHGATLTEFPIKNKTFAVIAGDMIKQIKIYINDKIFNVIKAEWVIQNFTKDEQLHDVPDLVPNDFHSMTEEMRENFKNEYDEYGDSYTEPIETIEQLKALMGKINTEGMEITTEEIIELEKQLFGEKNMNFFRGFKSKFHNPYEYPFNLQMKNAKMIYEFRAGEACSNDGLVKEGDDDSYRYVFVDKEKFKANDHPEYQNRTIVDVKFIHDSDDADKLLDIEQYIII